MLANLWGCQPKLLTWDTLILCNSNWPSSKGWTRRYVHLHHTWHRTDQQITLHNLLYWRMNKMLGGGGCFAAARANSCEGFRTSWWLSVCISFTLCPPCRLWAALLARHGVDPGQKPSEPLHNWIRVFLSPTRWVSGLVGDNLYIYQLLHGPTPMCSGLSAKPQRQASSLAQLAWPRSSGFAIIILGHLIQTEWTTVSSSTNEAHQASPTGLLLARCPLNELLNNFLKYCC